MLKKKQPSYNTTHVLNGNIQKNNRRKRGKVELAINLESKLSQLQF